MHLVDTSQGEERNSNVPDPPDLSPVARCKLRVFYADGSLDLHRNLMQKRRCSAFFARVGRDAHFSTLSLSFSL